MFYFYAYNTFLLLAAPFFYVFLLIVNAFHPRWQGTLRERLGRYGPKLAEPARPRIWVHAVSVGEVVGAAPFLRLLLEREKKHDLVVSTTTRGGMEILEKTFAGQAALIYFPIDFPWTVRRAIKAIRPSFFILMETEIWPNVINGCARQGVPVLLLNGRVSDRMAAAGRFVRGMYRRAFARLRAAGMQSAGDRDRLVGLGAPEKLTSVTGSMKFDGLLAAEDESKIASLRKLINPADAPLLVAGSTHPGEEEPILDAFAELRNSRPDLRLILCPRHIERAAEVEELAKQKGHATQLRSAIKEDRPPPEVVVVDTIGELRLLYRLSVISFVGGSLIPRGGHNVLEPAACGKAPFYGPHTQNFREVVRLLEEGGGGIPVRDADELREKTAHYLNDEEYRRSIDNRALETVKANSGAAEKAYELFVKCFPEKTVDSRK